MTRQMKKGYKTVHQDKIQDKIQPGKTRLKSGKQKKRKNFEGLLVGDVLYIEEIQIPHKTLTTYTDRYTQCGVITCITIKVT